MPRVDLQKYNKKVENPFAILWRLVCYFKHCRLLLTAAMLSILAYVAATIGAAYCMKPLTNLLEASGAAPNEMYAKYISLILGLAGLYLLSALTNYLLNRLMLECSAIIMKQLRTELFDTMQRLLETLGTRGPKDIHIASLLVKPEKLKVDLNIEYVAMNIPNDFIVGYGLDYDGFGRNYPDIYTVVD